MTIATISIIDRLKSKIERIPECGCWIWMGAIDKDGYGFIGIHMGVGSYLMQRAHRVSWELHKGPIPEGMRVLHQCDTPPCINPQHLFLGTQGDNMKDMVRKQRNSDMSGINNGNAKLSKKQAEEIRCLCKAGNLTQMEIATLYNISQSSVKNINMGYTWLK